MNTNTYKLYKDPKTCFIPTCSKTDLKNPDLKFFTVRKELKQRWCQLVGRNCPNRALFCCADHLNFEEDLENYGQWISGAKPRLKINAILKNFSKKPLSAINKHIEDLNRPSTSSAADNAGMQIDAAIQCDKRIGVSNKFVLAQPKTQTIATQFRGRKIKESVMPSRMMQLPNTEKSPNQSPSLFGTSNFDSSSSAQQEDIEKRGREHLLKIITNKPKMFLGLPKSFWWIINFIAQECSCLAFHIIICLFKLKNNDSFARMSEEFQMARSTIRLVFEKNVVVLSTYFQNCIYLPPLSEIKKKLPLAFKIRYSNVQCIIDCFEIQIEKPSDPEKQAQTWSQYKSCNTMKYLIGCTPAGYISFISQGYGGRTSDKAITENSGFVDVLPLNAVIMADRGFKEIESLLITKNGKLLRPPSVFANQKMTKKDVIKTKVIASLRVHVERVIRRLREFHMLKPHSVVNNKHLKYLDDLVIIACGLSNLQNPIIKYV
ncbi:uncharacterized protein LOC133533855 isoform X2 [Cydia pomonella]|uniref:uncharacterized protein LOC133533855 isoform X2 n=1 Tax=Cydia pomonella TaxID=82600 RepID=UPI002ADD4FB9|nr:uncharacterized protein LOC133533855 isoform X2 [Cydia pomonella]